MNPDPKNIIRDDPDARVYVEEDTLLVEYDDGHGVTACDLRAVAEWIAKHRPDLLPPPNKP